MFEMWLEPDVHADCIWGGGFSHITQKHISREELYVLPSKKIKHSSIYILWHTYTEYIIVKLSRGPVTFKL